MIANVSPTRSKREPMSTESPVDPVKLREEVKNK